MPSNFQSTIERIYAATLAEFGCAATYTSADGLLTWEGILHFKNPSQQTSLGELDIDPFSYQAEFLATSPLIGLHDRIRVENTKEVLFVEQTPYIVTDSRLAHDGGTVKLSLTLDTNPDADIDLQ